MPDETASVATAPVAPEAAPPAGETLAGAGGSDWRATLPPELQGEKSLERYKDTGALARAYLEAEKRMGAPLEAPGADAKPEQLSAYRKRMGLPESADKYEVTLHQAADGTDFKWDAKWISTLKERFHAAHAPPKALQAAIDTFHEYMHSTYDQVRAQQAQAETQALEENIRGLEQKWGPRGGPQWKHHQSRAEAAIRTLMADAPPAAVQKVVESANDPEVAHAFALLSEGLLERGFISGDEVTAGVDPSAAQAEIDSMRTAALKDPTHPLMNRQHPQHERTFDKWLKLQGIVAGPNAWKPIPGMTQR
jgi:hypothetical protein